MNFLEVESIFSYAKQIHWRRTCWSYKGIIYYYYITYLESENERKMFWPLSIVLMMQFNPKENKENGMFQDMWVSMVFFLIEYACHFHAWKQLLNFNKATFLNDYNFVNYRQTTVSWKPKIVIFNRWILFEAPLHYF